MIVSMNGIAEELFHELVWDLSQLYMSPSDVTMEGVWIWDMTIINFHATRKSAKIQNYYCHKTSILLSITQKMT